MKNTEDIHFGRHVVDLKGAQALFAAGDGNRPGEINLLSTGYDAILCLNGELHWEFFRKKVTQLKGDFLLTPPGMYYKLLGGEHNPIIVHLRFVEDSNTQSEFDGKNLGAYFIDCDLLCSIFLDISQSIVNHTELNPSESLDPEIIKKTKDLFQHLNFYLSTAEHCIQELLVAKKPKNTLLIFKVFQIIAEDANRSMNEISSLTGVSASYIARVFKETLGITPNQYISIYKLNKSLEHLNKEKTDLPGLSLDMGFTDQSHFTNSFKRFLLTTPGELKKRTAAASMTF